MHLITISALCAWLGLRCSWWWCHAQHLPFVLASTPATGDAVVKVGEDWEVRKQWYSNPGKPEVRSHSLTIGKYLGDNVSTGAAKKSKKRKARVTVRPSAAAALPRPKYPTKKKGRSTFSDFSKW